MTEKYEKTPIELDYLKAIGTMHRFDSRNEKHRLLVKSYLEGAGLEQQKSGDDWVYFENKDMGIRAFFSNYPMNNKKLPKNPSLSLEFTGHYFFRENSYESVRKMILWFTRKFGAFFNISVVDLQQDIFDSDHPFDYFPDFRKKENNLIWATRSKPEFDIFYENPTDENPNGFYLRTSRYKIMSYDRQLNIEKKLRRGEISQEYYDYYKSLYGERPVQRLEIRLKQDACKLFTLLFFNGTMSKEEILQKVMANFGRNHALKEYDPKKSIDKMKVNSTFSDLFFYEQKEGLKKFKEKFQKKSGINLSKVAFSLRGKSIREVSKMLGKKIRLLAGSDQKKAQELRKSADKMVDEYMNTFKNIVDDRHDRVQKTYGYMKLDLDELMDINGVIHSEVNLMAA